MIVPKRKGPLWQFSCIFILYQEFDKTSSEEVRSEILLLYSSDK